MANEPIVTTIITQEDAAARKSLIAGLESIQAEQKKLSVALAKGEITNDKYAKSFSELNKQASTLKRALDPLEKEFKAQEKAALEAEKAARKEAEALSDVNREAEKAALSFGELADQRRRATDEAGAGFSGDVASSAGGLRGAADALGAGAVLGKPLELIESLADIGEFAPLLASQISTLGTATAAAIPGISGAAAGVGVLAAAAIPIAIVLGAAAVAINNYNKAAEEQRKVLEATIDAQRSVREDVATGLTSDDATARLEELTRLREAEAESLASLQGAYGSFETQVQDSLGIFGGPVLAGLKVFDSREQELADSINESNAALQGMDAEILALQRVLEDGSLQANNAAATLEELKEKEKELADTRLQASQELTASLDRIAGFNEQIATLSGDRARKEAEAAEFAALESRYAQEDEQAETRAHFANLASIASDGRSKIESLQGDLAKLGTERQQALADIEAKGNSRIQKLNSEYMSKQLAESRAFAKETQRIEGDNAKARLRLIQDINDRLSDAENQNNIIAFLEAESDGRRQLKEQAEDARTEEQRRVDDFIAKQSEAQAAQTARMQETLTQIETEKQTALQSYNERVTAIQASIEAERVAIQGRTQAAIDSYNAQEAQEVQQATRQSERQALRDKFEQEAFDRSIQQIEQRRNAELAMYNEIQNRIASIGSELRNNLQAQTSSQSASNPSRSNSNPFSAGGQSYSDRARAERNGFTAFASGGIVDNPTLGLLAETPGMSEAVIPFRQSEGLDAGLARHGIGSSDKPPMNITIPVNMTVGDIATGSMVRDSIETLLRDGIGPLFEQALEGKF